MRKKLINIAVIIPYHHNLYDTLIALQQKFSVMLYSSARVREIPHFINHTVLPTFTPSKKIGATYYPSQLLKIITKNTDYVLVKHVISLTNFFVYLFCKLKKIKYIIMVQQFHQFHYLWQRLLFSFLVSFFIGKSTPILAVTKQGKKDAQEYFSQVSYIPACINPESFPLKKFSKKSSLHLLCVSKYMKRKNLPHLVSAISSLIERYPHIHFDLTIIGTAFCIGAISRHNLKENNVYADIKHLVRVFNLEKNVHLLVDIPHSQ